MTNRTTRIHHGGLFRCCLLSLSTALGDGPGATVYPGTVHTTTCCGQPVTLCSDGTWRWDPNGKIEWAGGDAPEGERG